MSKIRWFFSMCGNYSVVSAPRVMSYESYEKKEKQSESESALLSDHFPRNKSIYFSNFWVFWFFHVFHVFWCSGKVLAGSQPSKIMFFDVLKLWEPSQNDPESILETSFFHEIFSKNDPLKVRPTSKKTHMYIHSEPKVEKDYNRLNHFAWLFLISSNSTDWILRKSQNKIEKAPFGDVKD